jgi:hypothetical protein
LHQMQRTGSQMALRRGTAIELHPS